MSRKLEKLWTSVEELSRAQQYCLGRIGNRNKQYLEPALEFKLSETYRPNGELDNLLGTCSRVIDMWLRSGAFELKYAMLLQFNGPLDEQRLRVKSELEQLQMLQLQLEEEERQQQEARMERIKWFLRSLALLVEKLLEALRVFCNFSEFPNKYRPPCTTMPWDIRPALIVLWGVCWMFYSRSTTPQPDESQAILEVGLPNINSNDIFHGAHGSAYSQYFPDSLDQPSDWPPGEVENLVTWPQPWSATHDFGAWQGGFGHVNPGDLATFTASHGSEQTTVQPLASPATAIQNGSYDYGTVAPHDKYPTYTIEHTNSNDLLQSITAVSSQYWTQTSLPAPLPTAEAAGNQSTRTMALPQPSTNIDQPAQPARDSEGRMICDRDGCDNVTFHRRSAWKTHMDKHDRPFKCEVADCTYVNGFSSKGDLKRHQRIKHNAATRPSNQFYYCPEPSCGRSSSMPFNRRDNRDDHVKRKHKDLLSNHPANLPGNPNSAADSQPPSNPSLREPESPTVQAHAAIPGTEPQRRSRKRALSFENADSTNEELIRLREENQELKRKLRDLEHDLKSSKEKEETLFGVIKRQMNQTH